MESGSRPGSPGPVLAREEDERFDEDENRKGAFDTSRAISFDPRR
jgi:hypothetical protein